MAVALRGLSPIEIRGEMFFCSTWEWHAIVEYFDIHYSNEKSYEIDLHFLIKGSTINEKICMDLLKLVFSSEDFPKNGIASPPKEIFNYIQYTTEFLNNLPDLDCQSCLATGIQRVGIISPLSANSPCKECNGSKKSRPYIRNYLLRMETFVDFLNFMIFCGGFVVE